MVCSCCAYNCTQRQQRGSKVSFHSFPKDAELRKKWIIALKRDKFVPSNTTKICSLHFKETDFVYNFGRKTLTKDSVPSIFNFPLHLQKKEVKPRKRSRISDEQNNEIVNQINEDNQPHLTPITTSNDHDYQDQEPLDNNTLELRRRNNKRQRLRYTYFGDFTADDLKNPEKAHKMWLCAKKTINKHRQTIKYLQNRTYKLTRKINSLQDVIQHLKGSKKISDHCFSVLQECTPTSVQHLLLRTMKQATSREYSEELRIFALTLNFYSSSAYNYVRKTFAKCLPHPKTLQKWYRAVDGSPGYTHETLRAVEMKVTEHQKEGKPLVCNLVMDEMAIKQQIQWDGSKQVGYINYGIKMEGETLPAAKDAIVFLLVALNCRWKVPVAYFLINGLNGQEKANLINGCLIMLHKIGVIVTSITFDGAKANFTMCTYLGADLFNFNNLKTYFLHPITKELIFIILDPCHMIKLIRNALEHFKFLYDGDENLIKWEYFEHLVTLQEKMGLHAATKVRRRHLNFKKEIMKVKLAVQLFSTSVSDALKYFCEDLKLHQFEKASYTADFCLRINNIFDVMNTRNSLNSSIYKRSLGTHNFNFIKQFFTESKNYISSLKSPSRENILVSSRKTGFLGLIITMNSIEGILHQHVVTKQNLSYLFSYKLSQDHIEMFFSSIRSRGGFCNNPTPVQFQSAYKKILIHTELCSSEAANCLSLDETSILKISSSVKSKTDNLNLVCYDSEEFEYEDIPELPFSGAIQTFICDIVEYIAGFIVKKMKKIFKCNICVAALCCSNSSSVFFNRKNKGGLTTPSEDVIKICKVAEVTFRAITDFSNNNIIENLILQTTRKINFRVVFTQISNHVINQQPINNHLIQMVYLILKYYFRIRLNHVNKSLGDKDARVRHIYTKLIHFKHQ